MNSEMARNRFRSWQFWLAAGILLIAVPVFSQGADPLELSAQLPIATDVVPGDSDTQKPGQPGVATDGDRYLVVSCREGGGVTRLIGVIVSASPAQVVTSFDIADLNAVFGCSGRDVDVSFDGRNYLVVFSRVTEFGTGEIAGTRVSRTGVLLDGLAGFPILEDAGDPSVAFNGVNYLVTAVTFGDLAHDVVGALVNPAGQVGNEIPITNLLGSQLEPSVASDGQDFLVLWSDSQTAPIAPDADIFATRVSAAGSVLDASGIPVSTAPGAQSDPEVTFGGGQYFAVWSDTRSDTGQFPPDADIFGTRISRSGVLLDGPSDVGIPINTNELVKQHPAVSFDGAAYVAMWDVSFFYTGTIGIFGARIDPAGQLVDGTPDGDGVRVAAPSCFTCRLVHPNIASVPRTSLIVWINNTEIVDTFKDVEGVFAREPSEVPVDVTSSLSLSRSPFRYHRASGTFVQTVTIVNTSLSTLDGALHLVLSDLTNGVTLANQTGVTQHVAPLGRPYVTVPLHGGGSLRPGRSVRVRLRFSASALSTIDYSTQVIQTSSTP